MAEVASIWREARGIFQDKGRDRVPTGHVWDLVDYIPDLLGSAIRGRGGWLYQSDTLASAPTGMIFAPFKDGGKLLAVLASGAVREINQSSVGSSAVGTVLATLQNPVFHRDRVIVPAADGGNAARFIVYTTGGGYVISNAPGSALMGKYATVFKDRTILGGSTTAPTTVAFSKPGDPTVAWDSLSLVPTSLPLTGLAAQRNQILAFHDGSVERIRGTTPPDSSASDPTGDMILDSLFDRAGCFDARSIVNWQDNVIFADSRGVHLTDGAIVRNLCEQGGIETLWRFFFQDDPTRGAAISLAGAMFRDLYIVTMRNTTGPPITFACHVPSRSWFRIANVDSLCYASSLGVSERLWGTHNAGPRVIDISAMFDPDPTILQADADGDNVLPVIETGWGRFGRGEESLKRFQDLFVSYETGVAGVVDVNALELSFLGDPSDTSYTLVQGLPHSIDHRRSRIPFGAREHGLAVKVAAVLPTKDLRLYDIGSRMFSEEEQRVR